jgi:hypothetical protein
MANGCWIKESGKSLSSKLARHRNNVGQISLVDGGFFQPSEVIEQQPEFLPHLAKLSWLARE